MMASFAFQTNCPEDQRQDMSEMQQQPSDGQLSLPGEDASTSRQLQQESGRADQTLDVGLVAQPKVKFQCLYTKQKTQKRKVWSDGCLVLNGIRAVLHDANPAPGSGNPTLDECEITTAQRTALVAGQEDRIETDKYLIQVEGPWISQLPSSYVTKKPKMGISTSIQKLVRNKFRKPPNYVPPHSSTFGPTMKQQQRLHSILGKRRRPLQPGELERIHHGADHRSASIMGNAATVLSERHPTTSPDSCPRRQPTRNGSFVTDGSAVRQTLNRGHNENMHHAFRRDYERNEHTKQTEVTRDLQMDESAPRSGIDGAFENDDDATNSGAFVAIGRTVEPDRFEINKNYGSTLHLAGKSQVESAFIEPSGFDASSFYGYEDEEGQTSQNDAGEVANQEPEEASFVNSNNYGNAEQSSEIEQSRASTLSGSQILALFGASKPTAPAPKILQNRSTSEVPNKTTESSYHERNSEFLLPSPSSESSSDESEP